jgi:hypothetical protein
MQRVLLCLVSFVALTTDAFMHAFLADDSAVFPVVPNSSGRFQLSPRALFSEHPDTPTRASASWSKLNNTPILSRITRNEVNTRRVENMFADLVSVLMHTDDCTLLERQTQGMGPVYLDTNFTMSRPPFLLRSGVSDIMGRYNLPLRPVERKWNRSASTTDNTTSIGI